MARTPATRIEDVLARMVEIDAALPPGDGVGAFNNLYLAVTRSVLGGLGQATFAAPAFLGALDVAFANLYFAALRAFEVGRDGVPHAWLPLFDSRAVQTIAPIQFALAGMNAHINRDLPVALVDTFVALKFHGVDDIVAMWSVRDAREAAWTNGEALWHLKGASPLATAYLASFDRLVGFAGRGLLIPTGRLRV